ncbi:MAG TPA: SPFH domain-containing protein [Alphaproteobacteria bacterium]|nr:SPFH domain-containing protein [Alphaproteobacteria bacterium]
MNMNITPKKILLSFTAAAALVTGAGSFTILDETERGIDYRLGKMVTENAGELRQPGFSLKTPFFTSVKKVDVALQSRDYENVETYTKDNQVITAKLSVMFRIPQDRLVEIYKNNPDWEAKLERTVFDAAKSALGKQEAQNVAQNREEIMKGVTDDTNRQVKALLGLEIVAVKLPDFSFDDAFEKAVASAAGAKAELNRKETELEQQRVEKSKTIVDAEAKNEAAKLAADAEAYRLQKEKEAEAKGRLALAEAEAKGFNQIVQSIGRENMDTYLKTSKWKGDVPQVSGSDGGTIIDLRAAAPAVAKAPAPAPK